MKVKIFLFTAIVSDDVADDAIDRMIMLIYTSEFLILHITQSVWKLRFPSWLRSYCVILVFTKVSRFLANCVCRDFYSVFIFLFSYSVNFQLHHALTVFSKLFCLLRFYLFSLVCTISWGNHKATEAVTWRYSVKNVFLKMLQKSRKNTYLGASF